MSFFRGLNLSRHFLVVPFAVLVGLICVGPQLFFIYSLGNEYKGIYMMQADAEVHYLARMQESCDSGSIGNPYIKEYRDVYPSALYTYSEKILAFPACMGIISVSNLNLLYKFLLPALLSLLVYYFFMLLTGSRLYSLAGVALVMLGSPLVNMPDIKAFLSGHLVYTQFITFSRPVNPEFSAFFLWGYLIMILEILRAPSRRLYTWLGVLLGLSFYIYFYLFTFLFCLTVVLVALRRAFIIPTLIGFLIGLPVIRALYLIANHVWYAGLAEGYGLASTHTPIVSLAWIIVLGFLIIFVFFTKQSNAITTEIKLFLALMMTSLLVINTQVVTGRELQSGHYHWYFATPIFIVIIIFIVNRVTASVRLSLRRMLPLCLIVLAVTFSIFVQYSSYVANASSTAGHQQLMTLMSLIPDSTDEVVLAHRPMSELIPIYTKAYVVWDDYATGYLMPPDRYIMTSDYLFANPSSALYQSLGITYIIDYENVVKSIDEL